MGKHEFAAIANGDLALHYFGETTSAPQSTASDDSRGAQLPTLAPVWFSTTLAEMAFDSRASASMSLSMELEDVDATPTQTTELLHNRGAAIVAAATSELIRGGY